MNRKQANRALWKLAEMEKNEENITAKDGRGNVLKENDQVVISKDLYTPNHPAYTITSIESGVRPNGFDAILNMSSGSNVPHSGPDQNVQVTAGEVLSLNDPDFEKILGNARGWGQRASGSYRALVTKRAQLRQAG